MTCRSCGSRSSGSGAAITDHRVSDRSAIAAAGPPGGMTRDGGRRTHDSETVARARVDIGKPPADAQRPPHRSCRSLTAAGASSSCTRPRRSRPRAGARSTSRAVGPCRASSICLTTPMSRCRSRAACSSCPRPTPPGLRKRDFDVPAAWLAGRRVVLHVGAAESVLIAAVNGHEVGISKDSHLAAEFDVTPFVKAGPTRSRFGSSSGPTRRS